jgi:hypothetical protein
MGEIAVPTKCGIRGNHESDMPNGVGKPLTEDRVVLFGVLADVWDTGVARHDGTVCVWYGSLWRVASVSGLSEIAFCSCT